mmetsp:Transcript_7902/g.10859  ORF Transcript_7902/g.10859 Transcript_7902/m.10859 type:complete len:139 (-) Transcript_7902:69-485(-)
MYFSAFLVLDLDNWRCWREGETDVVSFFCPFLSVRFCGLPTCTSKLVDVVVDLDESKRVLWFVLRHDEVARWDESNPPAAAREEEQGCGYFILCCTRACDIEEVVCRASTQLPMDKKWRIDNGAIQSKSFNADFPHRR